MELYIACLCHDNLFNGLVRKCAENLNWTAAVGQKKKALGITRVCCCNDCWDFNEPPKLTEKLLAGRQRLRSIPQLKFILFIYFICYLWHFVVVAGALCGVKTLWMRELVGTLKCVCLRQKVLSALSSQSAAKKVLCVLTFCTSP